MLLGLLFPMGLAMVLSFLFTPIVIKTAHHVGAIDVPKDDRRVHKEPIPRLGGLAIYMATMITMLLFTKLPSTKLMAIVIGSLLIVLMGFVDDIKPISAKAKLGVQILAALLLVQSGIRIEGLTNFFMGQSTIGLDTTISYIISIIWIVGITNTVNLIDGLDGLAGGVATIAALTLAYVAFTNNRLDTTVLTLILAGACMGFLPYNFNPAKIFMGDTGSLFLGFMLAAISISGTLKVATAITFVAPILALGLPIFDTTFAIFRRFINGKPIMEPDKEHLHHRLLHIGLGQKRAVFSLYLMNTFLGLTVVMLMNEKPKTAAILFVIAVILIVVPIRSSMIKKKKEKQEKQDENIGEPK
jgi:UDP-GlcNAc:undecaprenyl-phosphate GlcNAc-1-phosphate transferase